MMTSIAALTGDLNIATVRSNPISIDCCRFSPPFGARLVALRSSSLGLSIDTSLETGVTGFEEREEVAEFVGLRDCGPVVLLFFNSFGCDQDLRSISGICCESLTSMLRRFGFDWGFKSRLVALSSSSLGLSIDTSLETGVAGFEEREEVAEFVGLRDCGPVVLLFFNCFGFELVVASAELPWSCLGSRRELVAAPSCCKIC
ncbi:receptor-like protein 12 [Dorcoceras hygrometricum]|uniref:Receptor-like protein 12 n=1 Tax=Dorcoceras hygrometricum TaxID=472368 RepID=A0A2Z7BLQ0_9LAMI|nr:receptor-like protein 12 [Dorcoceras hygrometricum]